MIRPADPEVLVVGAGPAGSTTAGLLALEGRDVLIVDRVRFPRAKPCGECLNPGAVRLLDRLGLLDAVRALGPATLTGWDLHTPGGITVRARFPAGAGTGLGVPRTRLDAALLEEARRRGARIWTGTRLHAVTAAGPGKGPRALLIDRSGRRTLLRPRVVVGADGLRSVVARSVGAVGPRGPLRKVSLTCHVRAPVVPPDLHRGALHLGRDGTVGIAPVDADATLWNVTVVLDPRRYGRALADDAPGAFRARLGTAVPDWREAEVVAGPWASGPFDRPTHRAAVPGVFLVGDAAGYYDPLTGQGIYRALWTARLAAQAVLDRLDRAPDAEGAYDTRVRRALAGPRRIQKVVERVVSGRLLRPVIHVLASRPSAADTLIGVTGDVLRPRSLLRPGPWLRRDRAAPTST